METITFLVVGTFMYIVAIVLASEISGNLWTIPLLLAIASTLIAIFLMPRTPKALRATHVWQITNPLPKDGLYPVHAVIYKPNGMYCSQGMWHREFSEEMVEEEVNRGNLLPLDPSIDITSDMQFFATPSGELYLCILSEVRSSEWDTEIPGVRVPFMGTFHCYRPTPENDIRLQGLIDNYKRILEGDPNASWELMLEICHNDKERHHILPALQALSRRAKYRT